MEPNINRSLAKLWTNLKSQSGSLTLTVIYATTGGILATLLFYNLVRYVGATNAVEQAARKAARCITPTDPECMAYAREASAYDLKWLGIHRDELKQHRVEVHSYNASMNRETWEQRYDTYETHMVTPVVEWRTYQTPITSYARKVNPFERRCAYLEVCARQMRIGGAFESVSEFPFPHYDGTYESNHLDTGDWAPYCNANDEGCCLNPKSSSCDALPQNFIVHSESAGPITLSDDPDPEDEIYQEYRFWSHADGGGTWHISELLGASAESTCNVRIDGEDKTCQNVMREASLGNGRWWQRAQLALKVEAKVCRHADSDSIKIGFQVEGDDGSKPLKLHVRTPGASDFVVWDYLGGRDYEALSVAPGKCQWFGLNLRGPNGSTGGHEVYHENIHVPRGSDVKASAQLRITRGTAEIKEVRFRLYYDFYQTVDDPDPFECHLTNQCYEQLRPWEIVEPGTSESPTDLVSECGFTTPDEGYYWEITSADIYEDGTHLIARTPDCWNFPNTFPIDSDPYTAPVEQASCSANPGKPSVELPDGRIFCGGGDGWPEWREEPAGQKTAAVASGNCPAGTANNPETRACDEGEKVVFQDGGDYGSPPDCAWLPDEIDHLNGLNQASPPSSPTLPNVNAFYFSWTDPIDHGWDFSWSSGGGNPICECGQMGGGCSQQTCVTHHAEVNVDPLYEHIPGSGWQISADDFEPILDDQGNPPPQDKPDNLNYVRTDVEVVQIDQVPPFNEDEAWEVAYFDPDADPFRFDFDWTCELDESCDIPYTTVEEALRAHAAAQIPEAADETVIFNFTDEPLYMVAFEEGEHQGQGIEECTRKRPNCQAGPPVITELGVFSAAEFPNGPPPCDDGTFDECISELADGQDLFDQGSQATLDYALAEEVAMSEILRYDPHASADCDSGGAKCAEVEIADVEGDARLASVAIRYNVPLTFPLDVLLGTDSVEISHEKKEMLEMRTVGRGTYFE